MVAAAASVPSLFTSTHASWNTSEIKRFCVPSMPEKLAFGPKASGESQLPGEGLRSEITLSSTFWI
jgi:hypothetical protein